MRSNGPGGGSAWWCIAGPSWSWWSMAGPGGACGCGRRKCCGGGMRPLLPIPETKDDARVVKLGQNRGNNWEILKL